MFQAGGLVVVLVEVSRKAYLASIVPVIVNAILNEHQIIVDIVAFVNRGDFPRSRLGEKQRGKILAGWVSRRMRTMAQFAIKDMDAATAMDQIGSDPAIDAHRSSLGSLRSSGGGAMGALPGTSSSLRNMEPAPQILEQRELEQQFDVPPLAIVEMPGDMYSGLPDNEVTPTKARVSAAAPPHGYDLLDFDHFGSEEPPPPVGPKPGLSTGHEFLGGRPQPPPQQPPPQPPQIRLPAIDGRESIDDWTPTQGEASEEDWTRDAIMHMNLAGDLQPRGNY